MTDLYYTLARFEEHYHYLESSFVDITRLIPLENEPDTFSPRLYELLQSVCSQVDGILNLMCEEYIPKEKPAATACEEDIPRKNKPACICRVQSLEPGRRDKQPGADPQEPF